MKQKLLFPNYIGLHKLFFIFSALLLCINAFSQPRIVWDTTFGGTGIEYGHDFARIPGGFIAVSKCGSNDINVSAATDPDGSGNHSIFGVVPTEDFWVKKLNNNGQIIWQNSLGGTGTEEATCVAPTSDGGYIVAGFIGGVFGSLSATGDLGVPDADASGLRGGGSDMWVVKLNAAGIMQWHNIIGGTNFDFAHDVIQTSDGGYLVVGDTYSNDLDAAAANDVDGSGRHGAGANPDVWVLKLRANGTIQWSNLLGGSTFDYGGSCIEVSGGYLISATSISGDGDLAAPDVDGTPAHGQYDYWVIKLDANGNMVWDNAIGGNGRECLYASPGIIATTDGNFVISGRGEASNGDAANALDVDGSPQHGGADYWVVKITPAGNILWRNHIGTSVWDEIESAYIACDGGIILSGYSDNVAANGNKTRANPNGARCPWLVKLNNAGQIEWDYAFASAGPNFDGPHHGLSYGMTKDYYVLIDSLGGDYFVLTTSQNAPGADKTAPLKGQYDSWFVKFTFELTADFKSDTACLGTPTQFTDLSVFTNIRPTPKYRWNFGDPSSGAANTSTVKNPTHIFTAPGTYSVTQIVQYECKYDTMVHTAYVPPPPTIDFAGNTLCIGSNTIINPSVNPAGGTFVWTPGGQTTSSITVSPTANTTYSLTYTEPITGCTVSAATTVTVNPLPALNIAAQTNVLCNGGSTGSATVGIISGTAPYTYGWNPTGQMSATATGLPVGTYSATVTDAKGCTNTITATITEPAVLQAFVPIQNNIICNGGTTGWATATQLGGTAPYSYSWNPSSQTSATITNVAAGTYSVTITDNNGCTAQNSVTLTQAPAITATVTVVSNPLCFGQNTGVLSVAHSNGTAPFTYNWNPGSAATVSVSSLTAGAYTVSINDANGCTANASATITEPPLLTMTLSSTPDHCMLGDGTTTISPSGGSGAYTYNWSPSAQNTATATGLSAGTYTATLTDNNGCSVTSNVNVIPLAVDTLQFVSKTNTSCNSGCNGVATLQLSSTGNGPYTYSWNTVPAQASLTATGLCAGVYILTVTDNSGCQDTMSITITQPPAITATLTSTNTRCFGDNTGTATATISGGTPGYTYLWNNSQSNSTATGLASGNYTITITDANGCSIDQAIQVNDAPQLIVNIPTPNAVCFGKTANVNANTVGGTPAYNYSWNTGQNTAAITTNTLAANTSLTVTITDNNGCTAQAVTEVTVNPLPIASFSSDETNGCAVLCINFNNTTQNSISQTWSFGDNGSSTQSSPNHCYNKTGSYHVTLTVTDNNGCSNTLTQNNYITVHPDPVASFTATPQPASILNPTIYFNANTTAVSAWMWSFGDVISGTSTESNPQYTYADTGNYEVQLIVINEFGCKDTITEIVRINPDYVLYVPNTFTPNGDGQNETFMPLGIGVDSEHFEFYIYDRWGNMIFKSTNPTIGWDGKANGGALIAQQDTYVWKIINRDVLGKSHRYEGHVNLIR